MPTEWPWSRQAKGPHLLSATPGYHYEGGAARHRGHFGTYSEAQHFIVLGIHGLALFSPTPRDVAGVRLCIECNPPQFKYNVSLSLGGITQ